MKQTNYKNASKYYFIGTIFNKGIAFLTVPIFTRILTTFEYGIVTTYSSWVAILAMIFGFALHTSIRSAYFDYKDSFDEFLSTVILFTIISSISIGFLILFGINIFDLQVNLLLVVLCLTHSAATAIIEDFSYYLMMQYRYKFRTAIMLLPNLISTILAIGMVMFVFENNLYLGKIIPNAAIHLVFSLLVILLLLKKTRLTIRKEYLKYALKISGPLIIHGIALNILSQSDRTMITWLADASQTGIYSLIYNFSMISSVITTALEGVWIPWFLNKMKLRQLEEIEVMAKDYINLMTYVMVCLIFVAPEIVKLLAAKSYWEGIIIIPPIVLSNYVMFMYTLYVNIEHYYKKTPYITLNTLIAASTNLILNYLFIPKYGYIAAAYTTIFSYCLSFILHSKYAKKLEPDLYPLRTFIRPISHIVITSLLFYIFMDRWIIRWGIVIIYFIAMLYKERMKIIEFFPNIKGIKFKK